MTPGKFIPHDRLGTLSNAGQPPLAVTGIFPDSPELAHAENILRYYATFVESSDDAIIAQTIDGIISSWNTGAERLFGYTVSEVIGQSVKLLESPDHAGEESQALECIRRGDSVRNCETVRQCKDGRLVDVSVTVLPVFDACGEVMGAAMIVRDITARKHAQQLMAGALQEIMQLKFALDEHAIVAITDPNGEITYVNDKFCAISKYSPEELIGQSHRIVESGYHSKEYLENLWTTTSEGRVWKGELKDRAKDGSTYWTQATVVPLLDAIGKPRQLVVVRTDITQQKLAAEALAKRGEELERAQMEYRAQAELLQWVFDSMGDGVVVADQEGKIMLFNRAAEQLLGAGRTGTSHREWSHDCGMYLPDGTSSYPPDDLPLSRAIRGETVDRVLVFVRHASQANGVWVMITARPLHENNRTGGGGVMVFRDISEAKRADEAAEVAREAKAANHAKNEFLSRMSHELRTPLNAIIGFAQLLEYGTLDPEQIESVNQIGKGGRELLKMVDQVLDISHIEAGRLTLSVEPVLTEEAIQAAIALVGPFATQMSIRLTVEPSATWKECVLADRQRLQQILLNLLSNAIKFNREAGQVTVVCQRTASDRLRLEVRDTGIGVPEHKVHLLFRPFERLDAENAGIEGTGVGLALSKRLAEVMGGELGVASEVGKGSSFWVELPRCENPLAGNERPWETGELQPAPGTASPKTILYVEDNPSNSVLMERIVANRPEFKLLSACQGRMGLELARLHQPDLILLDLHLPDLPGDQVLRHLQSNRDTAHIPVAMITADATPGQIDRLLAAGAQTYFTKPVNVKGLLRFFDETLG